MESTVIKLMKDVDVYIDSGDIEACHRIGKSDRKTSSKKTIVRFANRKYCKKALLNRKNFAHINSEMKYNFKHNNQIFINESLTKVNESLAFCAGKLKRAGVIYSSYTREGVVHVKKDEHEKATKVHHMNVLYDNFPDFVFFEDDEHEVFVDASPNALGQSSY